jgi:hypothetical protein
MLIKAFGINSTAKVGKAEVMMGIYFLNISFKETDMPTDIPMADVTMANNDRLVSKT